MTSTQVGLKTVRVGDEVEVTYRGHKGIRVGVVQEVMADAILVKQRSWLREAKLPKYAVDTGYRHFKIAKIVHVKVR